MTIEIKETHLWLSSSSGNPNKAWIIDRDSMKKISPLMSRTAALSLCLKHNTIIAYLRTRHDK